MPEFSSYGGGAGGSPSYIGGSRNWVRNPSFEIDTSFWSWAGITPAFFSQGVVHNIAGSLSLRLNTVPPNNGNYTEVSTQLDFTTDLLTPGTQYTFQLQYYGFTANGGPLQIFLDWTDNIGTPISTSTGSTTVQANAQTISLTATAPAGATKCGIRTRWWGIGGGATTIDVYIDAVSFAPGPLAAYFDGDSPSCKWLGTRGLSGSTSSVGSEKFMWAYDHTTFDRRKPVIIFSHGYSGDGWSERIDLFGGEITHALTNAGYLVMGVDAGGPTTFGNAVAMTSMEAARVFARNTFGVIPTKANLLGFSMGGLISLNYAYFNPGNTNCVGGICPATELSYFRNDPSMGGVFTAAIDADFSPSYITNGINAGYSPKERLTTNTFSHTIPVQIWHNQDDPTVSPTVIGQYRAAAVANGFTNIQFKNNGNTGFGHNPYPTSGYEVQGFFLNNDPAWN